MRVESSMNVGGIIVSLRGDYAKGEWSAVEYATAGTFYAIDHLGPAAEQEALRRLDSDFALYESDMSEEQEDA